MNYVDIKHISLPLVPLLTGALPLIGIHAAYLTAATVGHVDWCIPYWDGCASISKVGRHPPEELFLKGLLIPGISLGAIFWLLARRWLIALHEGIAGDHRSMLVLGMLGVVLLVIYLVALGERGETYQTLRRIGITLGVCFTYLAQLFMISGLLSVQKIKKNIIPSRLLRLLLLIVVAALVIGIINVLCKMWVSADIYDNRLEDAFEWNLILLLNSYFVVMYFIWRQVGPIRLTSL